MPRDDLIQIRGGTAAEWASINPVLDEREMGGETDTGRMKMGNGVDAWNSLPYADRLATLPILGATDDDLVQFVPSGDQLLLDPTGIMERADPYDRAVTSWREDFLAPFQTGIAGIFTSAVVQTGAVTNSGGVAVLATGTNAAGAASLVQGASPVHGTAPVRMKWRFNTGVAAASGQNWIHQMGWQVSNAGHWFEGSFAGTTPTWRAVSTDGTTPVFTTINNPVNFINGPGVCEMVCDTDQVYFYYAPSGGTPVLVATHEVEAMGGAAAFVGTLPTFKVTKTLGATSMSLHVLEAAMAYM